MIASVTFTTVAPETVSEIYREVGLAVEVDGEQLTLTNPKGAQRAQEAMMNASAIESDVRVKVAGGTDHGFTGGQQAEYDSLSAKGRDRYDRLRWWYDETHDVAFARALAEYGLKKSL